MTNLTGSGIGPALRPLPPSGFNASWQTPTFYRSVFSLAAFGLPLRDTFMDMRGWGKGFVVLNGFNLGRFWYLGPEFSLYVPAGVLLPGDNEIIVFEADGVGAGCGQGAQGEPDGYWPPGTAGGEGGGAAAAALNAVAGSGVRARLEARRRGSASLRPPPLRTVGGCPGDLPLAPNGVPFVTLREVPVRDLPT